MWNVKIKCKKVIGNVNNVINKMLNIMQELVIVLEKET